MRRPAQQSDDLFIGGLGEVVVELADGVEVLRRFGNDQFVDARAEPVDGGDGRDRHCDDELLRLHLAQSVDRGIDTGAGRNSVIDEDDGSSLNGDGRTVATIQAGAFFQLHSGRLRNLLDLCGRDARGLDDLVIEETSIARGYSAKGELFLPRHSKLSGEKDIQRRVQCRGNFESNGNTSTRYTQHKHVFVVRIFRQELCQLPPCILPISERHFVLHRAADDIGYFSTLVRHSIRGRCLYSVMRITQAGSGP